MNVQDQIVRVLVVEDNPADAALINYSLAESKRERFESATVNLLAAALTRIKTEPPHIVLLDLSLPDGFGIENCQRIHAACPTVPIVVLTGLDDEELALEALQLGAQDYLVKGQIDSGVLVRSLRYAIERQRAEAALQQAHAELEIRVARRTEELSRANEDLKQAISQRERAEELARVRHEELAHLARLNTLGEMASSLAHELNQPLTAIVAYTNSCLRRMSDGAWEDEEVREEVEAEMTKAAAQARRGAEIIQRLRRLVSKRESERVAFDVNESIRTVADLVAAELRTAGVQLQLALDESLPTVSADRVQIEQVLLNLVRNGIDSIAGEGGTLQVGTARDAQDEIVVKVTDNGPGADGETLGRLFEPFFSTKATGLGLGLSISRSILEAHRGKLSVAPNAGRGLTFRFTLPIDSTNANSDEMLASAATGET